MVRGREPAPEPEPVETEPIDRPADQARPPADTTESSRDVIRFETPAGVREFSTARWELDGGTLRQRMAAPEPERVEIDGGTTRMLAGESRGRRAPAVPPSRVVRA
jgi:hypothetical protein